MDININFSKTHVFADSFFKKKNAARSSASENLIFSFGSSGTLLVWAGGSAAQPRVKGYLTIEASKSGAELGRLFADYLSSLRLKIPPRITIVASEGVLFRQLVMPLMPEADLKPAVTWELKKKFFISSEENLVSVMGIREMEGEEGPEKLANVFYCSKTAVAGRLASVQMLGLPIDAFWPGPQAITRLVSSQIPPEESGDCLIVDLMGSQARIFAIQRGVVMLSRTVPTGQTDLALPEQSYERLANDLQQSIDYYEAQRFSRPISRIMLTGGGFDPVSLRAYLEKKFTAKIGVLDGSLFVSDSLNDEQREAVLKQPGFFAEALGALMVHEEGLSLLPPEVHSHNRSRRLDRMMRKVAVALASVFLFSVAWTAFQAHLLSQQLGFLEKEWKEVQAGRDAFASITSREKARRTALAGTVNFPALLKEVSRLTPSLIIIRSIQYSRTDASFVLSGSAGDSGNDNVKLVTQYIGSLSSSPFFKSVNLGQNMEEAEDGSLNFEIQAVTRAVH